MYSTFVISLNIEGRPQAGPLRMEELFLIDPLLHVGAVHIVLGEETETRNDLLGHCNALSDELEGPINGERADLSGLLGQDEVDLSCLQGLDEGLGGVP